MNIILDILGTIIILMITGSIALHYKNFKEWLVYACTEAESALGSSTGQLKLKYVYNIAIEKFPIIAKVIPFVLFSKLVDEALDTMKEMLNKNATIAEIVNDKLLK